ncbi:MAG: hypothetical protein ACRDRP_11705 [Pseudonocardiaceae bacterium]
MNMVIVIEVVLGIAVLAAAVRFAIWDTRQRRGVTESADTGVAPSGGGESAAPQHPGEVVDQREGEEAAALSAVSTATVPEPPVNAR